MDMIYLWSIAFFIGLVGVGFGLKGKGFGNIPSPYVLGIGAVLAIAGFVMGFGPLIGWEQTTSTDETVTIVEETIAGTAFDITPTNGSYDGWSTGSVPVTIASDEESATGAITVDADNGFIGNCTSINFSITPIAPAGADSQDLATIFFSVDENQKYDGEEIYTESSGVMRAQFAINDYGSTENYEGQHTMLMTDTHWVEFRCDLDGAGTDTFGEEFDAIGDTLTIPVSFWNSDHSWTQTFDIILVCVDGA